MLSSSILSIFAKSPLKPMQEHIGLVYKTATVLLPFFKAALEKNWEQAQLEHRNIIVLEKEADDLKKEIRLHLPNSLLLPIARGDLLRLLAAQDKIANTAKHLSSLIYSRRIIFPDVIANQFVDFVKLGIGTAELAKKAIEELDDLVETGFKGTEVKLVENMILALDRMERDSDDMQATVKSGLFAIEKDLNPIEVIFLYKTIDFTAELADRAQHVGHTIESLLAR